ncbi:OmpA family protein [Gymnodinialimonas ceratoperidinii]|uniref:OmpA family protein n=1 Tax=Gymnodinialimonas ceratoperidinii TaxID=2856823 RepID=A0A8F6YA82_9RHOB|nr:OmpA family protein [Gymnodinialimonas ceratoperidinii]QXT39308.1 OmpA family protein [Gymnodinialimonas ceratoperidinii]
MTHQRHSRRAVLASMGSTLALTACGSVTVETGRPLGAHLDANGTFGQPTRNNIGVHNGDIQWAAILGERFANTVPTTINFAFNSAELDATARAILMQQAAFIRNFPEVRFSVYGHTDAVGSNAYNRRLGRRRAQAAVHFLTSQGISRHRLAALVSFGETQPVVATQDEERRNRRTVTEVSGFLENDPLVLDGRYAEIIYRSYRSGGGDNSAD